MVEASAHSNYQLVAHVELVPRPKQHSKLHDAIPHRHTNRNPYQLASLPEDFVDEIRQIARDDVKIFVFAADEERNRIAGMMSKACDIVFTDPHMVLASDRFIAFEATISATLYRNLGR